MKHAALLFLLCLLVAPAFAQRFDALKFKIKVGKEWRTDSFGGGYPWEEHGSSVCACAGLIIVNDYDEKNLRIAVYPSTQGGLDSLKRQRVWHFEFIPVEKSESFITPNLTFTKKVSFLRDMSELGGGKPTPFEVWRYEASANGIYYLVYVFAENNEYPKLEPHRKEIEKVINSIQPLK